MYISTCTCNVRKDISVHDIGTIGVQRSTYNYIHLQSQRLGEIAIMSNMECMYTGILVRACWEDKDW